MAGLGAAVAVAALAATAGARPGSSRTASSAVAAPSVSVMVVGNSRILHLPRTVRARATTVAVGAKRCAIAGATPLAALAALRRAGGPPFLLRDFGSCSRDPADARGLFVRALGGEYNRGPAGWVYKVSNRAGHAGAADPAGGFHRGGRLRSGARVLWFWCRTGGRCQRTLAVSPSVVRVPRGGRVSVVVRAYDDAARPVRARGAVVTLGGVRARARRDGRATLAAPSRAGRYQLRARRAGYTSGFPSRVLVR
jgi:hypothetical protein